VQSAALFFQRCRRVFSAVSKNEMDRYEGKTFKDATGFKIMEDSLRGEKQVDAFKKKLKDFEYVKLKKTDDQEGTGFIADSFTWLTGYPGAKSVKKLVSAHGKATVKAITVYRTPIKQALISVANLLTGGKLAQAKKDLNYDKLFHLFMIITLSDGYKFRFEKNEVVTVSDNTKIADDAESKPVGGISGKMLLSDAIEKCKNLMGEKNFFSYSALDHNCQDFVSSFLKANGWLTGDLNRFIMQDVQAIAKVLPSYSSVVIDALTDIAGAFRLLQGQGRNEELN